MNKKENLKGLTWFVSLIPVKNTQVFCIIPSSSPRNLIKKILKFPYYFLLAYIFSISYVLSNFDLSKYGYITLLKLFRWKIKTLIDNNSLKIDCLFKEVQIDKPLNQMQI
ncbi:hypothetical protein DMUE_3238 [Dictyocoela muelleri]|nr:hypothetical protein DMUE_3238 [Dictyocoela muelleri]